MQNNVLTIISIRKAMKIIKVGKWQKSAKIPAGSDTSQTDKISMYIANFVSPPPRKIPTTVIMPIESMKIKIDVTSMNCNVKNFVASSIL